MQPNERYRVNYYVGTLLAQGGNVWMDEAKIVFSPTSAIDRAMGATDVEILIGDICRIEGSSSFSKVVRIKTNTRTHKFDGSQVKDFWLVLQNKFPALISTPVKIPSSLPCPQCREPLLPRYKFCPSCGTKLIAKVA